MSGPEKMGKIVSHEKFLPDDTLPTAKFLSIIIPSMDFDKGNFWPYPNRQWKGIANTEEGLVNIGISFSHTETIYNLYYPNNKGRQEIWSINENYSDVLIVKLEKCEVITTGDFKVYADENTRPSFHFYFKDRYHNTKKTEDGYNTTPHRASEFALCRFSDIARFRYDNFVGENLTIKEAIQPLLEFKKIVLSATPIDGGCPLDIRHSNGLVDPTLF